MSRRLTVIGVAALMLFAACSSSSSNDASSSQGKKYVDAMLASKGSSSIRKDLNASQARCLAEGLVNDIGVSTLQKAGVTPDDFKNNTGQNKLKGKLSTDQANKVADLILNGQCFDFVDVIGKESGSSPLTKLSKDKQRCFYTEMFKLPAVRTALVQDLTGGNSDIGNALSNQSQVFTILGKCKINPKDVTG